MYVSNYLLSFKIIAFTCFFFPAYEPATNHHSPLYRPREWSDFDFRADLNIDTTIQFYIKSGASRNKLVLGIPTYGRSYTLVNPDAHEIGSPTDGMIFEK